MASTPGFLRRAQLFLIAFGALYVFAVGLLTIPYFQSHTVYLNAIRLPWFAKFDLPEKYGLAPNKTLNFQIHTSDNETLGAWFILSDPYYHSLVSTSSPASDHVALAVKRHPTILFFHGNAATRAFHVRIQHYAAFASRLSANVLAIDYRGFGDSTGNPSEAGLVRDARAAWDWLIEHGTREEDILIMGHSLGTGVASQLGAQFGMEGISPRGIVLLSPFSSIREVLNTYHILGLVPLMKPIAMIPYATNIITRALIHKFDTLQAVPHIKGPVLIAHAENDWDIPYTHSDVLFSAFLEPNLPHLDLPDNPLTLTQAMWDTFTAQQTLRNEKRKEIVEKTEMANFGTVDEFVESNGRKVVLVKTLAGGHDYLGVQEGLQDIIGRNFGFF